MSIQGKHSFLKYLTVFYCIVVWALAAYGQSGSRTSTENVPPQTFLHPEETEPPVEQTYVGGRPVFHGFLQKTVEVSPTELSGLLNIYRGAGQTSYPFTIEHVSADGLASSSGLIAGDRIFAASITRDVLTLMVSRSDQQFRLQVQLNRKSLKSQRPVLGTLLDPSSPSIDINVIENTPAPITHTASAVMNTAAIKATPASTSPASPSSSMKSQYGPPVPDARANQLLSGKEVVLLIDRSGSMSTPDCPGNITRWDWCKKETTYLGWSTPSMLARGMTIYVYSSGFDKQANVSFRAIDAIYSNTKPGGMTLLAPPLRDAFSQYLQRKKAHPSQTLPLLIAVISDGYPTDLPQVKRAIIDATYRMSRPDDIEVVFIQISNDIEGSRILADLDNNLVSQGARFDIVETENFTNVRNVGVKQAIVNAMLTPHHSDHPVAATPTGTHGIKEQASNTEENPAPTQLEKIRSQRLQLERMLLNK